MARQATIKPGTGTSQSSAIIGFEANDLRVSTLPARAAILRNLCKAKDNLWLTADKMRDSMDAVEYRHVIFDSITTDTFKTLDYVFPPTEIIAAFDKIVDPLLLQIRANFNQYHTLATLRDTLLPKLLSGELTLAGLEKEAVI